MPLPKTTVIGAGLMGHGIAYGLAASGHPVAVFEKDRQVLDDLRARISHIATLLKHDGSVGSRITSTADLSEAVAGSSLVIEAVSENLSLKQTIFRQVESLAPADAVLASNTSSCPLAHIAAAMSDPARLVGAHFWNPPYLVKLVEVVQTRQDNLATVARTIQMLNRAGWEAVHVRRDIPGLIGNRLQHALKREAIALVEAGVCDAETVDKVVKLGFGARLGVLGPLEQSDLVGLDLTKAIHDNLLGDLNISRSTQDLLLKLVAQGDLGMKSGRGFRAWTAESAQAVRERLEAFLIKQIGDRE